MSDLTVKDSSEKAIKPLWPRLLVAVILLAAVAAASYWGWQQYQQQLAAQHRAEIQAEAIAQIEDQWGVRFTHLALVAQGGLLDVRYQVTDPDKAVYMFDEVENIPRIIASNGIELAMNDDPHTHDMEFGFSYFFLLRNIDDSVKPGDLVTIKLGELELPYFQIEQ
ncbi:MAG: hypothetical protein WAS33_09510 [Candidatus Promineifilaceae bacterium]|nr:hypothetical protein [Anaerolineaceae bacterium]